MTETDAFCSAGIRRKFRSKLKEDVKTIYLIDNFKNINLLFLM